MRLCIFAAILAIVNSQAVLFPHGYFNEKKITAKDALYLNLLVLSALEYGGTTVEELDKLAADKMKEPRIETPNTAGRHGLQKELTLEKHIVEGGEGDRPRTAVEGGEGDRPSTAAPEQFFPALTSEEVAKLNLENPSKPKTPFVRYAPQVQRDISEFSEEEEEEVDNPFAAIATRPPKHGRHGSRSHHHGRNHGPSTTGKPFLRRNQILGVHNKRPRQHKIIEVDNDHFTTPPPLPSTSPKSVPAPKLAAPKRIPYLDIILNEPRLVFLPTPPPL